MTPRDRRALLVGGAVAAVAWLGLRGVPAAVREIQARRSELAAKRALLARIRAEIREGATLTDSVPALERQVVALAPKILTGQREAEALTDLTGRVSTAASAHKVKLVRTVPVPDSARAGHLRRVAVRASLEGDTEGTLGTVGQLARGSAVLSISDVVIAAGDPGPPPTAPEVLQSELVLRGWYVERPSRSAGAKP